MDKVKDKVKIIDTNFKKLITYADMLNEYYVDKKYSIEKIKEIQKDLHTTFSLIENTLRNYSEEKNTLEIQLKKENLPKFKDKLDMTIENYNKFKKEFNINEQRFIIWLELFKSKINYLNKIIKKDLQDDTEAVDKIKLINKFYRQIEIVFKIFDRTAYMTGAPIQKINIIKNK